MYLVKRKVNQCASRRKLVCLILLFFSFWLNSLVTMMYCTSDGSIVSVAAGKGLPCDQDCNSREGKISRYSGPTLPEVRHNGCM